MRKKEVIQAVFKAATLGGVIAYWSWWCQNAISMPGDLDLGSFVAGIVLSTAATAILLNKIEF